MLKPTISLICFGTATVAAAEPLRLAGTDISDLVAGSTVVIDAPFGNKLPVRYSADGRVSGEANDLASYLGAEADTGRWWVAGDQLCHKWTRWFSAEVQCLRLRKEGRRIHWSSTDGNTGTAMITVPGPGRIQTASVTPRPAEPAKAQAAPARTVAEHAPARPQPPVVAQAQQPQPQAQLPQPAPQAQPAARIEIASVVPRLQPEGMMRLAPPTIINAPEPAPEPVDTGIQAVAPDPSPKKPAPAPVVASIATAPRVVAPKAAAPAPARTVATQTSFVVANVRRDDVLNMRTGPSAEHDIVAALPPGSRGVSITGACQSVWCPVQHEDKAGWVNRSFLASEAPVVTQASLGDARGRTITQDRTAVLRDSPEAPRSCLTAAARGVLAQIELKFGPVKLISTCRPGATIAGTNRTSRHASGNAVDFEAGSRKSEIVAWLTANHHAGGTMTYRDMSHIHVDIGPHFVSVAGGEHWASWRQHGNRDDDGG